MGAHRLAAGGGSAGRHAAGLRGAPSSLATAALLTVMACCLPLTGAAAGGASTTATGGPAAKTVLCLGDSLTAGLGLQPDQAFPHLLQERIDARGWNFRVVNAGVSGETSAGGLRRISWLLRSPFEVLVLELGANDALRGLPLADTRQNLQAIIDRVRQTNPRVRIIIAGMLAPPNLGQEYTAEFRSIFPQLAERNHALLIPFLLDGVAARPELNQADGIHPNGEGQRIVADNVWRLLEPLLRSLIE
ncbi:MAG: arylesterase [Acidobacteriota bacterium]